MDLQMTQVLSDEKAIDDNDDDTQVGILRVGSTEFSIVKGFTKIGRSPALCKVVLNDPTVSKMHAEIQAGCETAFISDARSANGTKIKDVPLKPFFYYTINDGDAIYLGTVKAIFTTSKSSERSPAIRPETPVPSRKLNENNTPGLGNASDCLFNNSSMNQSDDFVIPGTQRKEKKKSIFQEPAVPVDHRKNSNRISISSILPSASEKSEKNDNATTSRDAVDATDLYDLETQQFDDISLPCQSRAPKTRHLERFKQDFIDTNIYDAETQVLSLTTGNEEAADKEKTDETQKNDTARSSIQEHNSSSNFSRELQISLSPPDSPKLIDQSVDTIESQDLLELCETPLLEYMKKTNAAKNACETNQREAEVKRDTSVSEKSSNTKVSSISMEESLNRGKFVPSSHVIAESDDESVTDDDIETNIVKSHPRDTKGGIPTSTTLDVIEDDSTTDDEGKFESFVPRSLPNEKSTLPSTIRKETAEDRDAEANIFEAATQQMDQKSPDIAIAKKRRDLPREEQYDAIMNLVPTQILDVATSTPMSRSRKSNTRKIEKSPRLETEDNIHLAATQIMSAEDDIISRNTRQRSASISPRLEAENKGQEKDNRTVNPDETIMRNLGRILDEEANNRGLANEPTQLLTQNLVDILSSTQCIVETKSRVIDERIVNDVCEPPSPKRKRFKLSGTLGFVDGQAMAGNRWSMRLPTATSTMRDDRNEDKEEIEVAIDEPRESECLDEDDILFGLPEVKISGTLSNPGSPSLSTTSSHSDFVEPSLKESENSAKAMETVAVRSTESPCSFNTMEAAKSLEQDSPIVKKKSRVARRKVPRNLIEEEDQDSDEAYGYNDLKKMADRLLASDSVDSTRSRKKDNDGGVDKLETLSSTGRRPRYVRKAIPSNKDDDSRQRARKLPEPSSSLLVSDAESKRTADGTASTDTESSSTGASRSSSRLSKSMKSTTSRSGVASKRGKDSQEVERILAATPTENIPLISRKSYAKVELMRVDDNNIDRRSNDADNLESWKINKKRRTTMSAKDAILAQSSPTTTKTRRTIAEGLEDQVLPKEQHKILITGLKDDYSKIVKKLGGSVVSEPSKATVLITDKVRRTYKFLCAVARGLRVVSLNWLLESKKADRFLNCDDFILNDPAAERQYRFKLERSLQIARRNKFLEGYTIVVTPKVNQPEIHELKDMVVTSGGRLLTRAPGIRAWNSKTVIMSREEDRPAIDALLLKCPKTLKVSVQTTEFILTGILRQEVNLIEHKLDIS